MLISTHHSWVTRKTEVVCIRQSMEFKTRFSDNDLCLILIMSQNGPHSLGKRGGKYRVSEMLKRTGEPASVSTHAEEHGSGIG